VVLNVLLNQVTVVEESFDRMTVVGLLFDGTMKALCVSLDRVIAVCVTFDRMTVTGASFDRMTSTLSILAWRRSDAAEWRLAGVCED